MAGGPGALGRCAVRVRHTSSLQMERDALRAVEQLQLKERSYELAKRKAEESRAAVHALANSALKEDEEEAAAEPARVENEVCGGGGRKAVHCVRCLDARWRPVDRGRAPSVRQHEHRQPCACALGSCVPATCHGVACWGCGGQVVTRFGGPGTTRGQINTVKASQWVGKG